jgi:aryl-alcohol dehydrogenase-like predicted oxidoreductase
MGRGEYLGGSRNTADWATRTFEVSVFRFRHVPFGQCFGPIDPAEGRRAVHFAIERDINSFDVSPYYGLILAENRLGETLAGKRDKIVLATKCGRLWTGPLRLVRIAEAVPVDTTLFIVLPVQPHAC